MRVKAFLTALGIAAALCACPAGTWGAGSSVSGDVSELFRTWVWQGMGEDGTPRTMSFTFGEDGLAEIEEQSGGSVERIKASFRIEGSVIRLQALDEQLNPIEEMDVELPFALENGVLRLTLDDEEVVFRPLTPAR